MKYFYYPGCSLEGTAREYDLSSRALMRSVGAELVEIEDWTCCGASAADSVSRLASLALPARNLALAAATGIEADMMVPCSACFLNMRRADERMGSDGEAAELVNKALKEEGLSYSGGIRVRHLLDILAVDIGAGRIEAAVVRKLEGISVVPYYGCQALRPYADFDDPQQPVTMEPLIRALGCEVHQWSMGAKCCGAGLMTTKPELALDLVASLLEAAEGADCIATVCPMCQMNLESCQKKVSRMRGRDLGISIIYLPQLIGLALGLDDAGLRLDLNLAVTPGFMEKLKSSRQVQDGLPAGSVRPRLEEVTKDRA